MPHKYNWPPAGRPGGDAQDLGIKTRRERFVRRTITDGGGPPFTPALADKRELPVKPRRKPRTGKTGLAGIRDSGGA